MIHANLICDQMAEDLEYGAKLLYSREWLARVQAAHSAEIMKSAADSARVYSTLGFDPDYLGCDQSSIAAQLGKEFGNDVSALCAFYRFYYWRIWLQLPIAVVRKIARQMTIFYGPMCPAYNVGKSRTLTDEYERGVTSLGNEAHRKVWTAYLPAVDFMRRTVLLASDAPTVHQRAYIRWPLRILAATYLPSLLIALALGAIVFMQEERRRRLGWLAALVLFVYSYNLAACLEVAVLHSMEIRRFTTVQLLVTILAQFLALWFVIELALGMRAGAKKSLGNIRSM